MNNTLIHENMWIVYWVFHPLLAIMLFFISNWLGKHSYSFGYNKIDFIVDREDSAAFNFSLKVLTPTIFIILISTTLFHFKLDYLVKDIYLVVLYSVLFRIIINLFMSRFHILDWKLQVFYSITICVVAYGAYSSLILPKKPLIPDFNTISNELWILIGLFIYNIVNKIELSEEKKKVKIENYIILRHKKFSQLYECMINELLNNAILEIFQNQLADKYKNKLENHKIIQENISMIKTVVYSIMIFEDFNRPANVRRIENLIAEHSTKEKSLGIMQIKTNNLINNEQSIILGIDKILNAYCSFMITNSEYNLYSYSCIQSICWDYNPSGEYFNSVSSIFDILSDKVYKENIANNWEKIMNSDGQEN